jgi:hypothetical protein
MEKIEINKNISYLIGLFQTDGSLYETTRNRGKFQLELNIKDGDIIYKIANLIKYNYKITKRERITNFGENKTITITVHDIEFRKLLKLWGIPAGKKSEIIAPPLHIKELSIPDYIRGLYDGDGSLGLTKQNKPFMSLTTKSEDIKNFIVDYISKITNNDLKCPGRNKRDNIYNITLFNEDSKLLSETLYYENCLSINRKYEKSKEIKEWKRPAEIKKRDYQIRKWTKEQDNFILSNSIEDSMEVLDRTEESVKMRLWRLKKST